MLDDLAKDLKFEEGWVPYAYKDHLGFLTIGFGFLIDENKGGHLPEPVAEFWLDYILTRKWAALCSKAPWILEQPEDVQRALGNMCYQMGVNGVLNFKKMCKALRDGDRIEAAKEAWDSTWAKQTPERAKRVTKLMRG